MCVRACVRMCVHTYVCTYARMHVCTYVRTYVRTYVHKLTLKAELKNIKCGVPQGSILGPVLFILYINDMCEVSKLLNIILFADDTSIFYSTRNIMDIACTVNNELEKLDIWFRVNKLSLNVNKTNFIMFTNKKQHRPTVNTILNGTNIEQVSHTKFLGVIIDENLTLREQIKSVETKVSKSIGVLYKTKDVLDIQALCTLYQSLVEPYMCYCCEIWGNTYPSRLRKLSLLQKKAIRIIYSLDYHGHTSVFFQSSKILKLQDLITHRTMVML